MQVSATMHQSHISQCTNPISRNAPMHHFVTEMCPCVHISVIKRCIVVGYWLMHRGICETGILALEKVHLIHKIYMQMSTSTFIPFASKCPFLNQTQCLHPNYMWTGHNDKYPTLQSLVAMETSANWLAREHLVSLDARNEDTFTTFEIQIWLPEFILGIHSVRIFCAWPFCAEIIRYLGNDRVVSSLIIDRQLNIRITAWQKLGMRANEARKDWE